MNLADKIIEKLLRNNNRNQIVYNDQSISGEQVVNRSLALSRSFRKINFVPGDRVLIVMQDSPSLIYSLIGLIAIGCIPVPLNPKIEEHLLSHILLDSQACAIIIAQEEYLRLEEIIKSSKYIRNENIIINNNSKANNSISDESNTLHYLLEKNSCPDVSFCYHDDDNTSISFWQYTSGSSGFPKAVQHSHEAMIVNTAKFAIEFLKLSNKDRIYSIPKMFFGYGLGNSFFFPLIIGASVLIDHEWPSLEKINLNINTYKPTIFFAVPKLYSLILKNKEDFNPQNLRSIRMFFSAGAPLPESIISEWFSWTGKNIVNGFGSTEIGHVFICNNPESVKPSISGWVVPGYEAKLIDIEEPYNETTPGNIGELCVKPPYKLGKYWGDTNNNIDKFKEDWYHTGDLFIKDSNDGYVFKGRKDNLFKINGRWVNPEEIETTVCKNFVIDECALIEVQDEDELSIPVLFVVKKHNHPINEKLIMAGLKKQISSYKLPEHILFIDELPKNSNGKISRNCIKKLYYTTYKDNSTLRLLS